MDAIAGMIAGSEIAPGAVAQTRLAARLDVREDLTAVDVPTLVVATTDDRLVLPSNSSALAAALPISALVELASGHGIAGPAAEQWHALIRDFLADLPGAPGAPALRRASPEHERAGGAERSDGADHRRQHRHRRRVRGADGHTRHQPRARGDVPRFTKADASDQRLDNTEHAIFTTQGFRVPADGIARFSVEIRTEVGDGSGDYRHGFASFDVADATGGTHVVFDLFSTGDRFFRA